MNDYDAEDLGLAESSEELFLEDVLKYIQAKKNVSSKDLARALRCVYVPIPREILNYAADRLDGLGTKRGRPLDVTLESAREAFSDRDFEAEEIQAKFHAMKKNGLVNEEIFNKLKEEYHKSDEWVSLKVYPRGKK